MLFSVRPGVILVRRRSSVFVVAPAFNRSYVRNDTTFSTHIRPLIDAPCRLRETNLSLRTHHYPDTCSGRFRRKSHFLLIRLCAAGVCSLRSQITRCHRWRWFELIKVTENTLCQLKCSCTKVTSASPVCEVFVPITALVWLHFDRSIVIKTKTRKVCSRII